MQEDINDQIESLNKEPEENEFVAQKRQHIMEWQRRWAPRDKRSGLNGAYNSNGDPTTDILEARKLHCAHWADTFSEKHINPLRLFVRSYFRRFSEFCRCRQSLLVLYH